MIDYTLPTGKVRLLITDVNDDPASRLFNDEQLNVFLELSDGNVYRASAKALRTMAASEVLVSKVIRMQNGTTTDGAKVSAELRALADELDSEAERLDLLTGADSIFEFVDFKPNYHAEAVEWRLP